jgi:hypothetical protein
VDHSIDLMRRVHELEQVIESMLPEGEVLTHYDLVVSTRLARDPSKIRAHRFAPVGSDPEVSLGKMVAAVDRLRHKLTARDAAPDDPPC